MDQTFDYIIVGAGTAGCVLANRLSRDPAVSVLLLEAGGWDWSPLISIPVGARLLSKAGLYQWGDLSEPDLGLNNRQMEIPHGKVMGGTSSLNYMAHVRGHKADYADWVARGAVGWDYEQVLPYFKETETWEKGEDAFRGGGGELGARVPRTADPLAKGILASARELGYGQTNDYNGARNEGFAPIQYTLRDGRRSSTSRAFLRPVLRRKNLTVRTKALATRLIFEGSRVVGVEYSHGGQTVRARSADRTVLCLGAINTPHLLMLSGVGPADHLRSMSIKPRVDLPVGKNLEDHLGTLVWWRRKAPGPFHGAMRLDRAVINMLQAAALGKGPASELPPAVVGFLRTRPELQQPDVQIVWPTSAPDADTWFPGLKRPYVDGYMIRAQMLNQTSRGEVLLRSADPKDRPKVSYNSLSTPEDVATMRAGVKISWALGASPMLADLRAEPVMPQRELRTDEEIDEFVRATAIQLYHPASTCPMGDDDRAVLNPDLSVRGVAGLYVVDASSMPRLVSGNPNVVIAMMAAKAAAMWKGAGPPGG